jgi:multiple sugar transport system substrate-binding protein
MVRNRLLVLGIGLLLVVTFSAAASGAGEETGPQEIWMNTLFHGGDAQAMEMMVQQFNEANDSVIIDLTQGSWTEYNAQLNNSVLAGEAPQIATVLNFAMPTMYQALVPLNDSPVGDLLEKYDIKRSDYVDYIWDIANIDGKQYGIPLDNTLLGIYYNKDLFREAGLDPENPPETLEEFEAAAEALSEIGVYAYHPGAYGASRWYRRMWYIFLWQKDGELLNDSGTQAAFNTPAGREALEYLVSIRERGWNDVGTNGAAQFDAGELGMMINGTWHYLSLAETDFEWGFMGMPQFFDSHYTWGSNHFLVIPRQADNSLLEPAMEAISWLSRNSHTWGIYGGHVPIRQSALENPELRSSETWEKTLEIFTEMAFGGVYKSLPVHVKINEINAAIEPYIEEAYNGTMSVTDALSAAERDVNAVLRN